MDANQQRQTHMKYTITYHFDPSYEQIPYQARSEYNGEAVWVGGKSWDEAKANLITRLNRLSSATPTPEPETIEI